MLKLDILEDAVYGVEEVKIDKYINEMIWKYVKPTSLDKIQAVEKEYGINLPEDLVNLLLEYNNGRPEKTLFRVAGKERVFKKLLSYNKEDRENIYPYIDVLRNENVKLFPIASDPAGNFICLYEGNIVFWEHETAQKQYICDTITELIELLY